MTRAHVDELDRSLVGYLQENGRMSLITLAEKLGESHGTVRNRLDWLLTNGIVSIVAIVDPRSEEHTSELQSQSNLVCRLLLEKKKNRVDPGTVARRRRAPLRPRAPRA